MTIIPWYLSSPDDYHPKVSIIPRWLSSQGTYHPQMTIIPRYLSSLDDYHPKVSIIPRWLSSPGITHSLYTNIQWPWLQSKPPTLSSTVQLSTWTKARPSVSMRRLQNGQLFQWSFSQHYHWKSEAVHVLWQYTAVSLIVEVEWDCISAPERQQLQKIQWDYFTQNCWKPA